MMDIPGMDIPSSKNLSDSAGDEYPYPENFKKKKEIWIQENAHLKRRVEALCKRKIQRVPKNRK
jgi:hypothetical protein